MTSAARVLTKHFVKQVFYSVDPIYRSVYRVLHHVPGPIPPMKNRVSVGGHFGIRQFLHSGRNCYEPLKKAIRDYADRPLDKLTILDFGAGCGRTLRYFRADGPRLHATDIDASAVAYLSRAFPDVDASRNAYDPPLQFEDAKFDAVYAVSIWTHLPMDKQESWLNEMHRILRPGGLALITILGRYALTPRAANKRRGFVVTAEQLDEQGMCYFEYPAVHLSDRTKRRFDILPGVGSQSYGVTFHSEDYVRRAWSDRFEVKCIRPGVIDNLQDLAVLRKRSA